MARILLVEDDAGVRHALVRALTAAGHAVRSSGTAVQAIAEVREHPPEVVVLDLGLPDLDGTHVLSLIRSSSQVPVIVITARANERETVRLLHAGADDYVVKPFSAELLLARIAAVLRRAGRSGDDEPIVVGGLVVDPMGRKVFLDGVEIGMTRREFDLLAFLARRAGQVVTRTDLLTHVWQRAYVDDQSLDVHVSWVRRKLGESARRPRYLHTVRGVGLRLEAPDDAG